MKTVEVTGVFHIKTPSVPNFVEVNGHHIAVHELTDDQIDAICKGWANKFKGHVANLRATNPKNAKEVSL